MMLVLATALAALIPGPAEGAVDTVSLVIAQGMAAEEQSDARAMLDAARRLDALGGRPSGDAPDLASRWRALARKRGLIDRTPPTRGRALGPAYSRGTLAPGATLSSEQVFLAGQKAEIALVPQPGRSLTIRVASREREICERAVELPRATCSWLPVFTNRVEIRVANRGRHPANYYLVSN